MPVDLGPIDSVGMVILLVFVFLLLVGVPYWIIFKKAGFPGWYSLGIFVPILNIVMPLLLALSNWPALKESSDSTTRTED